MVSLNIGVMLRMVCMKESVVYGIKEIILIIKVGLKKVSPLMIMQNQREVLTKES